MVINSLKKIFGIIGLTGLVACGGGNRWDVSTGETSIEVSFLSWNDEIEAKKPDLLLKNMKADTRELYKYYLGTMIGVSPEMDSLCAVALDQFVNYPSTLEGIEQINKVYKDFSPYEDEIKSAFTYVKYHFADTKPLKVITYHSGFNFGVFPVENEIGIGLDMYLGENNVVTSALPLEKFPQYMKKNMDPKNLVVDVVRGYAMVNLIPEPEEKTLLARIVYEGKILLALDAFLPNKEDHEKIRYDKDGYDWCFAYEKEIWKDIVDNEWLYSTDEKMVGQFINEAPFTSTLPQNSPPRVGAWLGWQMVRAYANDHPELSLKDILNEKDAGKILRSYKPKK